MKTPNRVRRTLLREVAAVAVRKDEIFVTIVDDELSQGTARWAAALAVTRRDQSAGCGYGMVMRDEISTAD
ncbi:MAG: hypothetical protein AABM40_13850 [Chloroflexota bacterium]